jgi:hypothetical protein
MIPHSHSTRQESGGCACEAGCTIDCIDWHAALSMCWRKQLSGGSMAQLAHTEVVCRKQNSKQPHIHIFIEVTHQQNLITLSLQPAKKANEVSFEHPPRIADLPPCLKIPCLLIPYGLPHHAALLGAAWLVPRDDPGCPPSPANIHPRPPPQPGGIRSYSRNKRREPANDGNTRSPPLVLLNLPVIDICCKHPPGWLSIAK